MWSLIKHSALAGVLIAIGGTVYLRCESKIVGAVLFSVALLGICHKNYTLYTGRVAYATMETWDLYLLMLAINLATTVLCGLLCKADAMALVEAKLELNLFQVLIKATGCGILMFMSVEIYRQGKDIGILLCIPTFIVAGFEHCIADTFYFAVAREFSFRAILFLLTAIVGNTFGSLACRWLTTGVEPITALMAARRKATR